MRRKAKSRTRKNRTQAENYRRLEGKEDNNAARNNRKKFLKSSNRNSAPSSNSIIKQIKPLNDDNMPSLTETNRTTYEKQKASTSSGYKSIGGKAKVE
jgi:hypothetical protein